MAARAWRDIVDRFERTTFGPFSEGLDLDLRYMKWMVGACS
jgi:hypothetical protein